MLIFRIHLIIWRRDKIGVSIVIGFDDTIVNISWWLCATLDTGSLKPAGVVNRPTLPNKLCMFLYTLIIHVPWIRPSASMTPRIYLVDHGIKEHGVLHG